MKGTIRADGTIDISLGDLKEIVRAQGLSPSDVFSADELDASHWAQEFARRARAGQVDPAERVDGPQPAPKPDAPGKYLDPRTNPMIRTEPD